MAGLIQNVIMTAVAALVTGAVAIPIIDSVNTTGWQTTDATIWPFVKTFMILGLIFGAMSAMVVLGR